MLKNLLPGSGGTGDLAPSSCLNFRRRSATQGSQVSVAARDGGSEIRPRPPSLTARSVREDLPVRLCGATRSPADQRHCLIAAEPLRPLESVAWFCVGKERDRDAPRDENEQLAPRESRPTCFRRGRFFVPQPARRYVSSARGRRVLVVTQRSPLEDAVSAAPAKSRSQCEAEVKAYRMVDGICITRDATLCQSQHAVKGTPASTISFARDE
jgi:hypothetical protein